MPTYTVTLRINVPGLGERIVAFPLIQSQTIEDAITQAKSSLIVEPIEAVKTAG